MTPLLFVEQVINGLQLGVMLFMMAAGLTLVFGIMNLINLAHGSFYMLGAFFAASTLAITGNFWLASIAALFCVVAVGFVLEKVVLRQFYDRDHLDQVLVTFGLILVFDELTRIVWGAAPLRMPLPSAFAGSIELLPGLPYPAFRVLIVAVGLLVALFLYVLVMHTRSGVWLRAGASDQVMASALGVNISRVFKFTFALGCGLAALAGVMAGPVLAVQIGMGEPILVLALVVIVIGGIGSVRGAFISAIVVGIADTFGRVMLPPALGSMAIFMLMALVLAWRPRGLFVTHA